MNYDQIFQYIATYGVSTVLCVVLLFYVLKDNKERDNRWYSLFQNELNSNKIAIQNIDDSIKSRQSIVDQAVSQLMKANEFQRDEHNAMIKVLTQLTEQIKNVCKNSAVR